jgi:hypothetical protein
VPVRFDSEGSTAKAPLALAQIKTGSQTAAYGRAKLKMADDSSMPSESSGLRWTRTRSLAIGAGPGQSHPLPGVRPCTPGHQWKFTTYGVKLIILAPPSIRGPNRLREASDHTTSSTATEWPESCQCCSCLQCMTSPTADKAEVWLPPAAGIQSRPAQWLANAFAKGFN